MNLFVVVTYPIETPHNFTIESNIKPESHADIISMFIEDEIGKGVDNSIPNEIDVYHIKLELDLETDTFTVQSDTGNKGLRDGILIDVMGRLNKG